MPLHLIDGHGLISICQEHAVPASSPPGSRRARRMDCQIRSNRLNTRPRVPSGTCG
jgi:hypothetical protein